MDSLLEKIQGKSYQNIPSEVRAKNIASSLRRGLPCITFGMPNDKKVAVIGGGPSVQDDVEEIRNFDGFIVAINGMHDWLIEREIIPDAVVLADCSPYMVKYLKNPRPDITYLVCSGCDPLVFDALEDCNVILWHAEGENVEKGSIAVVTGPSAVTAAPYILFMLGYREIHLFGVDSSIPSYESHVYPGGNPGDVKIQVMVGSDVYLSTVQYALQAAHIRDFNKLMHEHVKIKVHGYGLVKAIFNNNGQFKLI